MNGEHEMNARSTSPARRGTAEAQIFLPHFARQTLLEPVLFGTDSLASNR
jgi:hypothetical protein